MNITQKLISRTQLGDIIKRHKSSAQYCLDLVRQHDYENFASTILLKNHARSSALAVRSFNIEISRIAEQVTQDTIGLMRMKFWEETLEKCFSRDPSKVPQHPVAVEIFKAIEKSKLTKRYFNNLVQTRKDHFNIKHLNTLDDLEKYSEQTVSNVYYLILEGCNVKNVNADHAASHLGKAQGIVQQLRTLPHAKRLNIIAIPQDILIKHHLSQESILRGKTGKELSDCVYEVASRAHQHLVKSRNLMDKVPAEGRTALLPAEAVFRFLDRLQRVDYDIFHPSLRHRSWKLLPMLWLNNFRNQY